MNAPNATHRLSADTVGLLFLSGTTAVMLAFVVLAPMKTLLLLMPDDAFYYLAIAQNWAAGFPSSFDRIEPTNGYHPLWQWLLVPMAYAIDARDAFARLAAALSVLCIGAGAWFAYLALNLNDKRNSWFILCWVPIVLYPAMLHGMEMPLALGLLGLLMLRLQNHHTNTHALLCTGMICAALILARLDSVAYVGCGILGMALHAPKPRERIKTLLVSGMPCAVALSAYLLINQLYFGLWTPISGSTKLARSEWFSFTIPYCMMLGIALLSVPVSVWVLRCALPLRWLAAGNLLYLALLAARGGQETWDWYFAMPALCIGVMLPVVVSTSRIHKQKQILLAMLACAAVVSVVDVSQRENKFAFYYERAMQLSAFEPDRFTFAASDVGVLGYFSQQRWINLDGLTAGLGFHRSLRDDQFAEWLQSSGMNAIIDYNQEPFPKRLAVHSWTGMDGVARSAEAVVSPLLALDDAWMIMQVESIHRDSGEAGGEQP